jgi:hypothetical protein
MRFALFAVVLMAAPATSQALDLPVNLRDGAVWTQTSVHTRTDARSGATRSRTVTSVIKNTYRKEKGVDILQQDLVSFDVEGVGGDELKTFADQAKMIYPAILEVDEALQPTRLRDWERVRELMFKALGASVTDARALAAVRASYDRMSDAQAATLFREQALVALGQGTGLEPGVARTYEGEVPNPMGGPPIKASGVFRLDAVDRKKGVAVVNWSQTPDPASLAASVKILIDTMLQSIAPEKQVEAKAQLSGLTVERSENCRYEVALATGLASTTDCAVVIKSGVPGQLANRLDHWVITQTLPEPR